MSVSRLAPMGRAPSPQATASWRRSMVRGLRPNDLSGKAGEIAAELEERLERGEYAFGESLSIYTLASQFDASRQPVATAVLYLRSVGYLEVIPQVGCRVVSPSAEEVQDFYLLFAHNEAVIAQLAAQRYEGDEADALLSLAAQMASNAFATREQRVLMADDVSRFHDQISAMARSPNLVDRVSNFRRLFRFYLSQQRRQDGDAPEDLERLHAHRTKLAHCIQQRDAAAILPAMEAYILGALEEWARVV